jgi:hypothetical protein
MRANVQIERVVLDGLELSRAERAALGPAIAGELRRLAGEPAGRRADTRRRHAGSAIDAIAREVATAVHRATVAARQPTGPAARRGSG